MLGLEVDLMYTRVLQSQIKAKISWINIMYNVFNLEFESITSYLIK